MKLYLIFASLCMATAAHGVSYPLQTPKDTSPEDYTVIEGMRLQDARGASTPPSIPKSWKLIAVSSGDKSNSSNLWFQDADGSVYLLQGLISQNGLTIHENLFKIPAK